MYVWLFCNVTLRVFIVWNEVDFMVMEREKLHLYLTAWPGFNGILITRFYQTNISASPKGCMGESFFFDSSLRVVNQAGWNCGRINVFTVKAMLIFIYISAVYITLKAFFQFKIIVKVLVTWSLHLNTYIMGLRTI